MKGESILWVICEKAAHTFRGSICLWNISWENKSAEVGYTLDPALHGKGIMQEAMDVVLDYGFNTMQLDVIDAYTHSANQPSINLLQRNGFLRKELPKPENHIIIYSLKKQIS